MRVYTYCSYKSGYNGYQYAFLNADARKMSGQVESLLGSESKAHWPEEFSYIRKMMEYKRGWKLILKKHNDTEGILMIAKVEEAADFLKVQKQDELLTEEIRRQYRQGNGWPDVIERKKESVPLNGLEPDFFINLVFVGEMKELKAIAVYYLYDLVDGMSQGAKLLNYMLGNRQEGQKPKLAKSSDRERYLLESDMYDCLWEEVKLGRQKLKAREKEDMVVAAQCRQGYKEGIVKKLLRRPRPCVRLVDKEKGLGLTKRRKEVELQIIDRLRRKTDFSQEYILIATDGGCQEEAETANMVVDMDYIKK